MFEGGFSEFFVVIKASILFNAPPHRDLATEIQLQYYLQWLPILPLFSLSYLFPYLGLQECLLREFRGELTIVDFLFNVALTSMIGLRESYCNPTP